MKRTLSRFKQLPLNSNFIQEIFTHTSFVERLLFDVKGSVNFSLDSSLDFRPEIVSGKPEKMQQSCKLVEILNNFVINHY